MLIPQGGWCVVQRHVRDTGRGEIMKGGITEKQARAFVARQQKWMNDNNLHGWNYWAMERKDY